MAEYVLDTGSGDVHLACNMGDGEFTFCDREWGISEGPDGEFVGEPHKGPGTCRKCKDAVDRFRASVKGARWSLGGGPA